MTQVLHLLSKSHATRRTNQGESERCVRLKLRRSCRSIGAGLNTTTTGQSAQFDLVVALDDGRNFQFRVPEGQYLLGRDEDCQILLQSPSVSGQHARISLSETRFEIEDLGSTSGTMVGSHEVTEKRSFVYPATIHLGAVSLIVSSENVTSQLVNTVAETGHETQADSVPRIMFKQPKRKAKIGEYKLGDEIAKGGMGSILEAEDPSLRRTVAMKVLLPQVEGSDEAQQRFVREATVLGRLEHPNIVPIHELGCDDDGRYYYTMKMVKGRTLYAILSAIQKGDEATIKYYSLGRLLTIFSRVCDAMAFTHFNGIVHRDLKPDNIMVGEFGEVLVMDWGVAKVIGDKAQEDAELDRSSEPTKIPDIPSDLTMDGAVVGTPHYMSPEQATGKLALVDAQSDVFSLGGILYSILALKTPVSGKTTEEVLTNIVKGEIEPPESLNVSTRGKASKGERRFPHCPGGRIPAALSAVAMRALSVAKPDRYQNVMQLAADMDAYQRGFATSAEEVGAMGQAWLFLNRHKRELIIGILIWIGISFAMQGGKALGTLMQSLGVVAWILAMMGVLALFARVRSRELKATESAQLAEEKAEKSAAGEAVAMQTRALAQQELEIVRDKLSSTQIALARSHCQAGEGHDAVRVLNLIPEAERDARWKELAEKARSLTE